MLITGLSYKSNAQVPGLPNPSSTQTIIQELGLGKVSVTYSRPSVKGRKIFGGLVPFGEVWRTGANSATAITFSEDAIIEGNEVPAGAYELFCIPEKDEWTIILNKAVGQWGAFTYDQSKDVIRFKVKAGTVPQKQEAFTVQFTNPTSKSSELNLVWDHTSATIQLKSNDDEKILANIDRLMETKPVSNLIYFNAVQYYYFNNKDSDKALVMIAGAEEAFPARASYKLFKSRFMLRKGDKAGARTAAETGIRLATEGHDNEYLRLTKEALQLAK